MSGLTTQSIQYPFSSGDLTTKIEYDANQNPTDVQFAQGSNNYDRVWDNRASYTYA